jgi:predicted dehydrogenase
MSTKPQVCIVGGGMITQVQILPAIYQLQRLGIVGDISICALNSAPLKVLAEDSTLKEAFPGQSFTPYPSLDKDPNEMFPDLFKEVVGKMPSRNIVTIALPDQLHYPALKVALEHNQHVCCVKPLVLNYAQAQEVEKQAHDKGMVVGVEYHKRLDDRALMAREYYKKGRFGDFRMGQAALLECWYYRHSNFQNWCTCENSDMFSYIACHYIDQLAFITGLLPKYVSVYGVVEEYPNGNKGYLWTDGRVIWENGGVLNVQNALGYPDEGPGGNWQGMKLYFRSGDNSTMLVHDDQYRGLKHVYNKKGSDPGDTCYVEPSPDYFKYVNLGGEGLKPVGYGYRSIELFINNICKAIDASEGLDEGKALAARQKLIKQYDDEGVMATPKNSSYNELVMEAGRLSILNDGREVEIIYGKKPGVDFRKY